MNWKLVTRIFFVPKRPVRAEKVALHLMISSDEGSAFSSLVSSLIVFFQLRL